MAEGFYHIADGKEILQAALKFRIRQSAVCHIGKRNLKTTEHFTRGEESALGIAQAHAIRLRALITRPPEKNRYVQILCEAGTFVLRSEISVREKQAVNFFLPELLRNFYSVLVVIQKTFFIDICDIHIVDAHFIEFFSREICVFDGIGRTENGPSCRSKTDFYLFFHDVLPPVLSAYEELVS